MNDALVSAQKYDNAEAATLFIIIFAFGSDYFASALTYFCAKRSRSIERPTFSVKNRSFYRKAPFFWGGAFYRKP